MSRDIKMSEIEEFLTGPAMIWFISCLKPKDAENLTYSDVVCGALIHKVFVNMELNYDEFDLVPDTDDPAMRLKNLNGIMNNLKRFYEEDLGHVILQMPDVFKLAKEPTMNVKEARLLLCLLLGCAVQCPKKEVFIKRICEFDETTQNGIAEIIAQVVHYPAIVLGPEMLTHSPGDLDITECTHFANVQKAYEHMRQMYRERNIYRTKLRDFMRHGAPRADLSSATILDDFELSGIQDVFDCSMRSDRDESQKRDAELMEFKTKVRVQNAELKGYTDDLQECREELMACKEQLVKMQKDNEILTKEARTAQSYRDELDEANEKLLKTDRLEQEVIRYKQKLENNEYYRTRVDELQEHNRLLAEHKNMLDEQVSMFRSKAERVLDLEQTIFQLKQEVNDLTLESAADRQKYRELQEENSQLEKLIKISTCAALGDEFIIEDDDGPLSMDGTLSEELSNNAQSCTLKLELENRRLSSLVDNLKEKSFQESSTKILELEKDKKKLSLKVEALQDEIKKLNRSSEKSEGLYKEATWETEAVFKQELDELLSKCNTVEKNYLSIKIEKERVDDLLESLQKRLLELEHSLAEANRKLNEEMVPKDTMNELKANKEELASKIAVLEAEKSAALENVERLEEEVREKISLFDASQLSVQTFSNRIQRMEDRHDETLAELTRYKELAACIEESIHEHINSSRLLEQGGMDINSIGQEKLAALIEAFEGYGDYATLSRTNTQLTAEKESLLQSKTKLTGDTVHLRAMLKHLHEDFENTVFERNQLRVQLRDASAKLRQHVGLLRAQNASKNLKIENNLLKTKGTKNEYAELKDDFRKLYKVNQALSLEYRKIRTNFNNLLNSRESCKNEMLAKNRKIIHLELEFDKLNSRYVMLSKVREELDRDKRCIMNHNDQLLRQYQNLMFHAQEDRDYYHLEDMKNNMRINALCKHKERLEEKIMNLYAKMESSTPKKKSIKISIIRSTINKMRKAGSELLNRSRKSWAEYTNATEKSYDFDFTLGSVSDESRRGKLFGDSSVNASSALKTPRNRKSVDFLANFRPSDFTFGEKQSRKSVAFAEVSPDKKEEDDLDKTLEGSTDGDVAGPAPKAVLKTDDLSFPEESDTVRKVKKNIFIITSRKSGDKKKEKKCTS